MSKENQNQTQPENTSEVGKSASQNLPESTPSGKTLKKKVKLYAKIFLVVVLVGIIGYAYYIVDRANKLTLQAQTMIDEAKKYNFIIGEIRKERDNCVTLLSPSNQQADFGTFKYCEKFIEWSNKFFTN